MLKEFAEELKKAREKAGVTLQVVATKTRIDLKFLEALEEGNFNFLPDLYVKAFIKQYAREIGLDEEGTIHKYNIAKEGIKKESSDDSQLQPLDKTKSGTGSLKQTGIDLSGKIKSFIDDNTNLNSTQDDAKKQYPILFGIAALGLIIISVLVYVIFFNNTEEIIIEERPYEEVLQNTPSRFIEEPADTVSEQPVDAVLDQLTLTISNVDSVDSAWVYVISDGTTTKEFLLLPNISSTVTANNNFRFTLGNSGVIKLTLNNEEIPFDGSRGAVRHFKVDRNGIERIYLQPQVEQE